MAAVVRGEAMGVRCSRQSRASLDSNSEKRVIPHLFQETSANQESDSERNAWVLQAYPSQVPYAGKSGASAGPTSAFSAPTSQGSYSWVPPEIHPHPLPEIVLGSARGGKSLLKS